MLMRSNEEGESFFNQIVTGDETWLHYWTPECKSASTVWKSANETAPQKFKENHLRVKF